MLRRAEVIKVPALRASAMPQRFADPQGSAQFATATRLPAAEVFYEFRHPDTAAWAMSEPELLRFDGALAWHQDDMLSVVPIWEPLTAAGAVAADPSDALVGGPVMRVVFGPEASVEDALDPGTVGAASDTGAMLASPDMQEGGEHERAADRAMRCAPRFIDVLAALELAPAPKRQATTAAAPGGRPIPRVYAL